MLASADGCKGGWLLVKSKSWPCKEPLFLSICADFRSLVQSTLDCEQVVVDIPIGLPSGKKIRTCDEDARRLLGREGSTRVFLAPPREAMHASDPQEFQILHSKFRGKGAGWPVWGIVRKLKEVDEIMTPDLQKRIHEFHPELAWWRAAGRVLDSKHQKSGLSQRTEIVGSYISGLNEALEWERRLGRAAAIDDILDALIGIPVAANALNEKTFRVPHQSTESDTRGLSMEIWY
ncbi:MAG TPA: DUF429 domain-containing protein [Candidatus Acidoferrum sp.]|nr:DUF429 domain-containing protein [Candidatus Acidoferrum sp.]